MQMFQKPKPVTLTVTFSLLAYAVLYPQSPAAQTPVAPEAPAPSFMQASPVLNVLDVNHDARIGAAEIADAPARLKTLDKNADGKLTRDEAGLPQGFGRPTGPGRGRAEGRGPERGGAGRDGEARSARAGDPGGDARSFEVPIAGPTGDELLATLMMWDRNKDGRLAKAEIPERQQGILERGDTDKNGVLDQAELKKLTTDQAAAPPAPPRGPGRGGFGGLDLVATALDSDRNGEISAEEIAKASTSLMTLDKNSDGTITEDEVRPMVGGGRGPGN